MAGLAILSIVLAFRPESTATQWAIRAIWGVFVVEYLVRLGRASRRRRFVADNLPDLIAVLPLDFLRVARVLRLVRFLRVLRGMEVLWRVSATGRGILRTNGVAYALVIALSLVLLGGAVIRSVEPAIGSYGDGVWWGLVTMTTVGYGDIAPKSTAGRVTATVLMLVGIGVLGLVTASMATYFLGHRRSKDSSVRHVQDQLAWWDEMTPDERVRLARLLLALSENERERMPR